MSARADRVTNLDWLPQTSDPLADAAEMYAAHGWPIFPCAGKQPLVPGGFRSATTDADAWRRRPDVNIGWPLPEGLFALDVDPRHGGTMSRRRLEREYSPLPFTLRAITGSGGEHWIFRTPAGVEIRQLAGFCDGLDTRVGGRGYLLVAPSVHPETGAAYRWLVAIEPVEAPGWLVDLVKVPPVVPRAPYVPPSASREMDRRRKYALAALKGCVDDVRSAVNGQRNNALNIAWFRMAQLRDAVDRAEVEAALLDAALAVGLSEREARQVMR